MRLAQDLFMAQGLYYAACGLWPVFSVATFQSVTGPKTDIWLVKTVGLLIAAIGVTLFAAGWRDSHTPEMIVLAASSAIALAAVDIVYSVKRVISYIYLAAAAAR